MFKHLHDVGAFLLWKSPLFYSMIYIKHKGEYTCQIQEKEYLNLKMK